MTAAGRWMREKCVRVWLCCGSGMRTLTAPRQVRLSLHRAKQSATAEVSLGETK